MRNHLLQIKEELICGVMDVSGKEQAGFDVEGMEDICSG